MTDYLARIQAIFPDQEFETIQTNSDGLVNDVVIVNDHFVFRFAKDEYGQQTMATEIEILNAIAPQMPLAVPLPFYTGQGVMAYELLPGEALTKESLSVLEAEQQQILADQIGGFLRTLHQLPADPQIPPTLAPNRHEQWVDLRQRMEQQITPFLLSFQVDWMRQVLSYVDQEQNFDFTPCLIHGDLACYHLLYDPEEIALTGVIDFGVAGMGDPATDLASLLQTYGASFVHRMLISYPEASDILPRARFYAQAIELQWVLLGLESGENFWFTAHLGGARDIDE